MNKNGPDKTKLTPPMQTIPGEALYDTLMSDAIPRYRFGVARIDDQGNVEICESVPTKEALPTITDGERYTENVIQTYSVHVPYTATENGVSVTKHRTEHRTRTVPIQRIGPKPGEEDQWETKSYTVSVPYTEQVGDTIVRRARLETRTRLARIDEPPRKFVPKEVVSHCQIEELECFSPAGIRQSVGETKEALQASTPVILVNHADYITDYFEAMMKPDALLIVSPVKRET
jgi:hypothetical protein